MQEVWLFTERLRHLLANGVPEAEAVGVILDNMPEGRRSKWLRQRLHNLGLKSPANLFWRFRRVLQKVLERIESGHSLSQAMISFPKYFPASYVAILAAGEHGGDLPEAMRVAGESLRRHDVRMDRVLLGIMIPPIAVGYVYLQLKFLGHNIWPMLTEMEIGWSVDPMLNWVMDRLLSLYTVALVTLLLLFAAFFLYPAFKNLALYRFCLLMNTMLRARVPLEECRELCVRLSSGSSYQGAVEDLFGQVAQGRDLAAAMGSIRYFPQELKWIVASGHFRGDVSGAFSSAADVLRNKADTKLARMLDMGPPLLTVLTAIPVGILAFGVFSFFKSIAEVSLP